MQRVVITGGGSGIGRHLAGRFVARGDRVAICDRDPGAVEGDRMDRVVSAEAAARGISEEEVRALYVRGVSMRSWVTVEDVAETVLFLASPAARRISGQILAIDGHTETLQP